MAQDFGIIWRNVSGLSGVRGANFFVRRLVNRRIHNDLKVFRLLSFELTGVASHTQLVPLTLGPGAK
jgi:hypothetical protein